MEISPFQPYPWRLLSNPLLQPYHYYHHHHPVPVNYVHWTETPESHIFSADVPGVRKEELKVEIEDSRYLIIRTMEGSNDVENAGAPARRRFMKKFRLPVGVDLEAITAGYEDGVLTVTVPRLLAARAFYIRPEDDPQSVQLSAPAA